MFDRPTTTAFFPDKSSTLSFKSNKEPRGVQGIKAFLSISPPIESLPALIA